MVFARDPEATALRAPSPARTSPSLVLDAWVDGGVEDVGEQIDPHHDDRDEEADALDDRVVARLDRLVDPETDTRPGEDRLGEDLAGQQATNLKPDDRQHRDQRLPEHVARGPHAPRVPR